ncbi:branched-chain amino acid aminotransferase [Candidatus Magnetoovum chiemensis]|nr:branched-chain amino acid aminotransferase [Candidatus Magnetoovum chiemensis]
MINKKDKIWMSGKFVNWDDANIHILTHTMQYGLGLFEGIRCYKTDRGPAVFRLKEHINRLFNSAKIMLIEIPFEKQEIENALVETIRINKLEECYIRPFVYIGYGDMGLYPKANPIEVAIAAWQWGSYLGDDGIKNGIKVKVSSYIRNHVNSNMSRAKISGYYINSQLAKKEAVSLGFDEALLLDTEGYISEGSGENIFILRNNVLKTTPLTSILEGITRESIMILAEEEGLIVKEQRFTRDELYICDEAFFTGTAAEVTPIVEADRRVIASGKPGEKTKTLQKRFFDVVKGKEQKYIHWLTFVD